MLGKTTHLLNHYTSCNTLLLYYVSLGIHNIHAEEDTQLLLNASVSPYLIVQP